MDMLQMFGDDFEHDGKRRFKEHNERIRSLVPANNLLELKLGEDGWDPICKFLNAQKPDEPYPRSNTSSDMAKKFDLVTWYCCKLVARKIVIISGVIAATVFL
ncbi:MAG: hypothetical protein Q9164_007862, partial [Protoblastenia rupestris]